METLGKLIGMLAIPIMLLNALGGIVAAIWLGILGEWGYIGYGLLALVVAGFGLSLAMMPSMIFSLPAMKMLDNGHKITGYILALLGLWYVLCVVVGWCMYVIIVSTDHSTTQSLIPALLWAYTIGTAPIQWLAQKDAQSGNQSTMLTAFFIQVAFAVSILSILCFDVQPRNVLTIFSVILSFSVAIQLIEMYQMRNKNWY